MTNLRYWMNIVEGIEDDKEHEDALEKTGFWGAQGAGCIFFAQNTKKFLIAHRSYAVEQPNTWGTWGGAIDKNENPLDAVKREVQEEAGFKGDIVEINPMFVFESGTFRYSNFLIIVREEFTPELNWESQGFKWCEYGKWPRPLHFGLKSLFNDPKSATLMKRLATG